MNLLEFLKKNTKISIDSADLKFVKKHKFDSLTTNPTLILNSIINNSYNILLKKFFLNIKNNLLLDADIVISYYDYLLIFIAGNISPYIKDKISIEIPARISFNYKKIIIYSQKIIFLCTKFGLQKDKILIKIPATNSGILAAAKLKNFGIECNLTLIFDMNQVKKCFDNGIYLISPFVGRISDNIKCFYDSGVNFVKNILYYKKSFNYKTKIMAASFRNINQILNLYYCDYLTISPLFFEKLKNINFSFDLQNNINFKNFTINYDNYISSKLLLNGIIQFEKDHNKLVSLISFILNNI
ncbi:transaldolase family protein [Candidatus Carsonella ruddii]|uniref:Transaldolase n=1 Tax=Candidatus Carsonella ruddii (Diaphorina cf. continua) TaxID=2661587 RepID=A0A7R7AC37_CARRU|nr:transaldolase family protein [Candidatus Carsonella ruddii (Diaphorina cf. continua)]BCG49350.1 transaldolase [Candidatus Carsonella ruddii (Diaphorina cf. continua)]